MNFGVLSLVKSLVPWSFYISAFLLILVALTGNGRWPLLFVTFLLPLRNVVEKLQYFPLGNKLLTILIFAILLGSLFANKTEKEKSIEKLPLSGILIIFIFYMFVSLQIGNLYLGSENFFDAADPRVKDWKNFCLFPIIYLVTFKVVRDEKWIWRIFLGMCAAMVLMSFYTVTQIHDYSSLIARDKINGSFQFLGPNEVAAFYAQYTIILISIFFFLKKKTHKIGLLLLILINVYCVIFLYSRGAYLGFSAGLIFLLFVKRKIYLIPLFLILISWQAILPVTVIERIQGTKTSTGELEVSAAQRLDIWGISMNLFAEQPVFGIGYGVFRHLGIEGLQDTHNIYVKYLVEQGVVGLIIFLTVLLNLFKEGFTLFRNGLNEISKGLGLGFAFAIITLMVNSFFGDRWSYFELSAYLWVFAGLVARLNVLSTQESILAPVTPEVSQLGIKVPTRKSKKSYYK